MTLQVLHFLSLHVSGPLLVPLQFLGVLIVMVINCFSYGLVNQGFSNFFTGMGCEVLVLDAIWNGLLLWFYFIRN